MQKKAAFFFLCLSEKKKLKNLVSELACHIFYPAGGRGRSVHKSRIDAALAFIFCLVLLPSAGHSSDQPFDNPANWGGTGLMEIPTARVLPDGHIRLGYAEADPYRWLVNSAFGVFPGLEISGRYTELKGVPSSLGGDFGDYKDKALDIKYQLFPESKRFPAVAIRLHDFHGTGLFAAEYLVLSRQMFPFDFTLGIGSKRLKGDLSIQENPFFFKEIKTGKFIPDGFGAGGWGLFGGIEWAVNDRLHLMVEFNPVKYEDDPGAAGRALPEGAGSPINFGMRVKALPGLIFGLSYQRGDTLGLMCHLQTELGKPLQPKRPDPPLWMSVNRRSFADRDLRDMVEQIRGHIIDAGFKKTAVYVEGNDLVAEIENGKYLSNAKAVGRVLRILTFYAPVDTGVVRVVLTGRGMKFLQVSVRPDHMEAYLADQISQDVFSGLLKVEYPHENPSGDGILVKAEGGESVDYRFGVKPSFETYLNDPSGVFKSRFGIKPYVSANFWKGFKADIRYDIPFYSDIESALDVPEDVVLADVHRYKGDTPRFERVRFDQKVRLWRNVYAGVGAGYLDTMYAGIGGEMLAFVGEGNLALGIEGEWVRKREVGSEFALMDVERYAVLGNIYYFWDPADISLNAKYGRFLGGDIGWRFSASREYSTGIIMGAWLSFTDTDVFKESYNRDYRDKGVFISIPIRMFTDYETSGTWSYALSPWTRDVAQTVDYGQSVWDMAVGLMKGRFFDALGDLKK